MPKRVMYTGGFPRQLDLPTEVLSDSKGEDGKPVKRAVDRGCDGALHLRPGRVHVLTDDELELARGYKDMKKQLRVLGELAAKEDAAGASKKSEKKASRAPSKASGSSGSGSKSRAKAAASGGSASSDAASN